jgi:hypothetical protein
MIWDLDVIFVFDHMETFERLCQISDLSAPSVAVL